MKEHSEKELINLARKGNAGAFERLINTHYGTMYKMAFKWCGNREDAQDITQNACIKLARNLNSFRGDSAFTSWLYRLVINTAKDYMRSNNRHTSNATPLDDQTKSSDQNPDQHLYTKEVIAEIHKLPEAEKEALLLVVSEGFSHKEVAEIMQCAESTVSWRVHEARKKLNAALKDREEAQHG